MEKHLFKFSDYLFAQMSRDANDVKVECTEQHSRYKELTGLKKWILDNALLLGTLLGVVFGAALGFGLRPLNLSATSIMCLSYPGELFIRILKLIILPLIISSLIAGSASLNARLNGRIALRTLLYFLVTSVINAILGVVLVTTIHPGNPGLKETLGGGNEKQSYTSVLDSLLDLGRNIIADNIFQATFQQAYTNYINTTVKTFNEITNDFEYSDIIVREIKYSFISTAASFSSASVPSAALVLLMMVLSAIDTPVQDVSLLFAVDWIVDRFRTTNNMLGDCYTAVVVEKLSKKELMACDSILSQETVKFDICLTGEQEENSKQPNEVIIHKVSNQSTMTTNAAT